jgi:mannose-1-phosphate guanylyltransferase
VPRIAGNALVLDGTGNVVVSDDATLIATVGVSDLVVVKSGDAILVIRKDAAQDVRKVIDALSARGLARYL